MKTKTINLYQFEELTPEQQEKVIEKYNDINDDSFEFCLSSYVEDIKETGFKNPDLYYSLSYSQGDGACFECEQFDFDLLLKDWQHKHKNWIVNIIKQHYEGYIKLNSFGYHYSHSNTRYFILSSDGVMDCRNYPNIEKAIEDVENHIENLRYELSEQLTSDLYNELEYLRSDDAIKETLIANEYYFNAETLEIEW